jgi:hypothetical protein
MTANRLRKILLVGAGVTTAAIGVAIWLAGMAIHVKGGEYLTLSASEQIVSDLRSDGALPQLENSEHDRQLVHRVSDQIRPITFAHVD